MFEKVSTIISVFISLTGLLYITGYFYYFGYLGMYGCSWAVDLLPKTLIIHAGWGFLEKALVAAFFYVFVFSAISVLCAFQNQPLRKFVYFAICAVSAVLLFLIFIQAPTGPKTVEDDPLKLFILHTLAAIPIILAVLALLVLPQKSHHSTVLLLKQELAKTHVSARLFLTLFIGLIIGSGWPSLLRHAGGLDAAVFAGGERPLPHLQYTDGSTTKTGEVIAVTSAGYLCLNDATVESGDHPYNTWVLEVQKDEVQNIKNAYALTHELEIKVINDMASKMQHTTGSKTSATTETLTN